MWKGLLGFHEHAFFIELKNTLQKVVARLFAKVYEVDPFRCPKCFGRMHEIAIMRPSGA
jgi:hypothetical protein